MRDNLIKYNNGIYRAKFGGFGHKITRYGPALTVLLLDVKFVKEGIAVADHLWADFHEGFVNVDCRPGDMIEIVGHAKKYKKGARNGYRMGNDNDYKLVIENVMKIMNADS